MGQASRDAADAAGGGKGARRRRAPPRSRFASAARGSGGRRSSRPVPAAPRRRRAAAAAAKPPVAPAPIVCSALPLTESPSPGRRSPRFCFYLRLASLCRARTACLHPPRAAWPTAGRGAPPPGAPPPPPPDRPPHARPARRRRCRRRRRRPLVWGGRPPGGGGGAAPAAAHAAATGFWARRHLFFAVSSGRSGTHFLSALLRTAASPPLVATHEPAPQMGGPTLRTVLYTPGGRAGSLSARAAAKVGAMARALAGTRPDVGYAETSHQFVVTWADAVLGALADAAASVTVIVLERPVADVAASQARLGWFGPRHSGWGVWYYDPARVTPAERALPPPPGSAAAAADPQAPAPTTAAGAAAAWAVPPGGPRPPAAVLVDYNLDVAARGRALVAAIRARHAAGAWPRVRVVHVDVGGLARVEGGRAALNRLGVVPDEGRLAALYAGTAGGGGTATSGLRKRRGGGGGGV
ncbi:hypothetical protein BU14_0091s0006 [Porphyra umbilicalis]|uniref:Sulfotransferase domain-containing protein n=1 Tax=Porphyra umbilicalis TaxID=2786 RepID=A0A1X6PE43_PORUM|nr:hypothetical protein BU14_0091s0006 [Porphyra umbilicalis]|eukprot:OSX79026.1 hypothetical protein BU14_0091s0006 [Porphyra umbilicalis]